MISQIFHHFLQLGKSWKTVGIFPTFLQLFYNFIPLFPPFLQLCTNFSPTLLTLDFYWLFRYYEPVAQRQKINGMLLFFRITAALSGCML
jgi:hypothetical protein